jgi:pimeloyl-ACP methyl ester carboxylesterase
LLLVHGFPLDHSMWVAQLEFFASRCRVIAPDLRGFGASEVTRGTVTMAQFADDLAALLERLSVTEPVHYAGLSMGGYIGWEMWRRHGRRLASLILCDTRAADDTAEVARGRDLMATQVLHEGTRFVAEAMLPKLFSVATAEGQAELLERTRRVICETDPEGVAAAQRGMARRENFTGLLPQIKLPILVLCGQHDVISPPAEMRRIADALPAARFVEIPRAGHMAPLEQPAAVNEAIREFWQG